MAVSPPSLPPRRRFLLAAPVRPWPVQVDAHARPPVAADAEALARLMLDAYRGGVDDEGETPAQARAVVDQLFAGEFGPLLYSLSEVTERDGVLVAATLLTLFEGGPFLAFTLTDPQWRRQGLAAAGLRRAFKRLADGDEPWLRLVVTQGNTAAEALYESLGFRPVAQPPFTTA